MTMKLKRFFLLVASSMLCAVCGLLVACGGGGGSKKPGAINQTSIKYDGATITWDAAENAEGYQVSINGGNEIFSSTNKFNYRVSTGVDQVEITIYAKGEEENGDSATKIFTRLPKIEASDITFSATGVMSWTAVEGANEYILKINGTEVRTAATEYADFEFGKSNRIQIKPVAVDDSSFSEWSTEMIKEYLAVPSSIQYDGQTIRWQGNNYAARYAIYIGGGKVAETTGNVTYYDYDSENTSFEVQIQAIGNGTSSFDSAIGEITKFTFLPLISDIRVDNGNVTWPVVEEATGYQVEINGVTYETPDNFYPLPSGKESKVRIKPITTVGSVVFADWSEIKNIKLLTAPELQWNETMKLDGAKENALFWDPVTGDVIGYNVKLKHPNGEEEIIPLAANTHSFEYDFLTVGTYKVSVQTAGDVNKDTESSAFSEEITVTRLPAPNQAQKFVTSDRLELNEGFTLNWFLVSGATSYRLYKNGDETDMTTTIASMTVTNVVNPDETQAQTITYGIQSIGSTKTFRTERKVTLSSLSDNLLEAEIKVLAMPTYKYDTNGKLITISGYTASWNSVPDASYGYATTLGDGDISHNTEYSLEALTAGTHEFSVCAIGNGENVLPSYYTPTLKIIRLATPINIEYSTADGEDGKLSFDNRQDFAKSYSVWFNGNETNSIDSNEVDQIAQNITTASTAVNVRAIANYFDESIATTYYVNSLPSDTVMLTRIAKLAFKTPSAFDGTKLVWNEPSNVGNTDITYRVYDGNNRIFNGALTNTEYDVAHLEAGSHTFYVKAVGDGTTLVNSEISAPVTIFKLATPNITQTATGFTWTGSANATAYVVKVEGKVVKEVGHNGITNSDYFYDLSLTDVNGTYDIEIYAKGDNGITTIDSTSYTKTIKTKAASAPVITLGYSAERYNVNENIVIKITGESNYTRTYKVEIKGVTLPESSELVFNYNAKVTGEFTASVYATGGKFDENFEYYYVQSDAETATITLYNAPTNLDIGQESVTWKAVSGCKNYHVILTFEDGTTAEFDTNGAAATFGIDYTETQGVVKAEVSAVASNSTSVSSEYAVKEL